MLSNRRQLSASPRPHQNEHPQFIHADEAELWEQVRSQAGAWDRELKLAAHSRLERKRGAITFPAMSTLTEIEAAVDMLPEQEQVALLRHLNLRLRRAPARTEKLHDLTEFSGTISLREDPLAWQQEARNGWR